jgi:prophage regulatory protein
MGSLKPTAFRGHHQGDEVKILKFPEVRVKTGLSRTTVWREERAGRFPKRVRLTANSVGWVESEILAWMENRPRGLAALTVSPTTIANEVPNALDR